jgi:hypothetical protein
MAKVVCLYLCALFAQAVAGKTWAWLVGCSHLDDLQAGTSPFNLHLHGQVHGARPALPAPDNRSQPPPTPDARLKNGSTLAVKTSRRARVIVYCQRCCSSNNNYAGTTDTIYHAQRFCF